MRGRLRKFVVVLLTAFALAAAGWLVARPSARAPRAIVMATGPAGGSYAALGERYREILARYGLRVELRATEGDGENLALLQDPASGVSVAFLQSGITSEEGSPGLESLGAMLIQPVWVFRHGESPRFGLGDLEGRAVSVGSERSGSRAAALRLFAIAGMDPKGMDLVALPPDRAAEALVRGDIDAMVLVASWESPVVRRLVASEDLRLDEFRRADAFVALDPAFEKVVLPEGVGDMADDRPSEDVTLLALKASLIVPRTLDSSIQYLLLEAASDIHGRPGIFHRAGQFPSTEGVDLPLSRAASDFHRSGRPFLQRYMPYWVAVLLERLLLVLLPLVGVVLPLFRAIPFLYNDVMEKRVIRLYGELKVLEMEVAGRRPGDPDVDLVGRLDALEIRANHLRLPERFLQMRYTLKQHIDLVRGRLTGSEATRARAPAP